MSDDQKWKERVLDIIEKQAITQGTLITQVQTLTTIVSTQEAKIKELFLLVKVTED